MNIIAKLFILIFLSVSINIYSQTLSLTIDRTEKHQHIDGFGFFGAQDVWWSDDTELFSDAWAELVLDDLGMTIWRNEYYPPRDSTIDPAYNIQDADWEKQSPVVAGLKAKAEELNVPLKIMLSVWSPPASMKCAIDEDYNILDTPHPTGTKYGGALCPDKYEAFAEWLIEGIHLYEEIGVDVYAISPQNEPLFEQYYNSCVYPLEAFPEMLKTVIPIVKNVYPDIKFVGAENMVELEVGNYPYSYGHKIIADETAFNLLDLWGGHGYINTFSDVNNFVDLDRVDDRRASVWNEFKSLFNSDMSVTKSFWMTEGSGNGDDWGYTFDDEGEILLGTYDLGKGIWSALVEGNASAWVWWQGSNSFTDEHNLMNATEELTKRYFVCKQFFRYIRPGAQRIEASTNDEDVHIAAFEHQAMNALTIVLLNDSDLSKNIELEGADLPTQYDQYTTTENLNAQANLNKDIATIVLPPSSIVTLVNGNVFETSVSTKALAQPSENLKIAPNPIKEDCQFFIEKAAKNAQIRLINAFGQVIFNERIDVQSGWQDLSLSDYQLPSGIYFLAINTADKRYLTKLEVIE